MPPTYRPTSIERRRDQDEFQLFVGEVLTVDYERKVCTLMDQRTFTPYQNIRLFPANASSFESTDVDMPEVGSKALCAHVTYNAGFRDVAVVNWLATDTNRAQQAIAMRMTPDNDLQGWNQRVRGNYRKAYPGQQTKTTSQGYAERKDDGWDRLASDMSRDWMDPETRTLSKVNAREVAYNDGGQRLTGTVVRPGAKQVMAEQLPDGRTRQIVYLQPNVQASNRYVNGQQDVIALCEHTEKIQEFALDFPIPVEAIGTTFLDKCIGTTADPWGRTVISQTGGLSFDDQSFPITQDVDHPYLSGAKAKPVGPTTSDGPTPRRRGYIIERTAGTMVGSNLFDQVTYGNVLKPVLFPYTTQGRFAVSPQSGYLPVNNSTDHVETRVAASAYALRFTHEGNTSRVDLCKEGNVTFEIGSTLPKENIPLDGSTYENPHGAGRSLEGHCVGSAKLVIGKNRDEEEALDLTALGQTVLRLGADDTSLPNQRRNVQTQIRGSSDMVQPRTLQYWKAPKLVPGDAGSLTAKTGGENVSLFGAMDGGTVLRIGARNPNALRRHLINGYMDGPGVQPWAVTDPNRVDSKTDGRPTYGAGDSIYRFHDLTQTGAPTVNMLPYSWSGSPVTNVDSSGLSLDLHLVQDALVRVGKNTSTGQSLLMDLAGGLVAAIGKDNSAGRSITATLDGGCEITIGMNNSGKSLAVTFLGDLDVLVKGNYHLNVTGDFITQASSIQTLSNTDIISKAQNQIHTALSQIIHESPSLTNSQGLYSSSPNTV
jgi:hypothetical protein